MLPSTYKAYSIQVLGYVAEPTPITTEYVATVSVQRMLETETVEQVLLSWNSGEGAKKCSSGVNKNGTPFDSCRYVQKGMNYYNNLK